MPAPERDQPLAARLPFNSQPGFSNGHPASARSGEDEDVDTGGGTGRPVYRWYHKLAGVMAAIFCFELGVFLLIFPWTSLWDASFPLFLPVEARAIWSNPYLRGAVSGLGLLNIYISLVEVFRLRRFSA